MRSESVCVTFSGKYPEDNVFIWPGGNIKDIIEPDDYTIFRQVCCILYDDVNIIIKSDANTTYRKCYLLYDNVNVFIQSDDKAKCRQCCTYTV